MSSNRWVAIDPDILTHPLVGAGQPMPPADPARGSYSRMEAWLWVICNASFVDHTVMNRGRKMTLKRGDLLGAYAFLAHTFNWPRRAVKAWVDQLIADNMLQRKAIESQCTSGEVTEDDQPQNFFGNQATILGVVNYWRFQFGSEPAEHQNQHQPEHQSGHQSGHQSAELSVSEIADKYILQQQHGTPVGTPIATPVRTPIRTHITMLDTTTVEFIEDTLSETSSDEKPKRSKRKKINLGYTEAFEVFWGGYPDRTNNSKAKAFAEWQGLSEADQNAAVASLPAFGSYCRKNPDYRCLHAERYLRDRRWESYLEASASSQAPWWKDPAQIARLTEDRWRSGIDRYANGIWDVAKLGPPPGSPNCVVPAELVSELRLTDLYTDKGIRRQ